MALGSRIEDLEISAGRGQLDSKPTVQFTKLVFSGFPVGSDRSEIRSPASKATVSVRSVHAVCPVPMVQLRAVAVAPFMTVNVQAFPSAPGGFSILIPRFEIVPPNGIRCWKSAAFSVNGEVE